VFLSFRHNRHLNSVQSGFDRGDFQHSGKSLTWSPFIYAPRISAFCPWMTRYGEYLNITLPNSLTAKHFFDRLCASVFGVALVQLSNHHLQPFNVFLICHNL